MIYYRLKMNKFDTVCDFLYNFSGFCTTFTQQAIILSGMERRKKNKRVSDFFPYTKKQPVITSATSVPKSLYQECLLKKLKPKSASPSAPPSVPPSALPSTPPTVPSSAGKVNEMASFVQQGCKICLQKDKEVCFKTYLFIFIPSDQQTKSKLLLCLSNTIDYLFLFQIDRLRKEKKEINIKFVELQSRYTKSLESEKKLNKIVTSKKKTSNKPECLSNEQRSILNTVDKTQRGDSTFIRLLIKYMYPDEAILLNRCVRKMNLKQVVKDGQLTQEPAKQVITPEKKDMIQKMFSSRIEELPENDIGKRNTEAYLNRLMGRGIKNIVGSSSKGLCENIVLEKV